jgi:hypothetical protein
VVLRIFFLNEIQMCTTVRCKNKDDDDAVFRLGWVFIFKVFLLLLKINSRERERVPGVSSSHVIWPCTSSLMFYRNIIIKILSINSIILFFLFFFRAVVFFFFSFSNVVNIFLKGMYYDDLWYCLYRECAFFFLSFFLSLTN